MKPCIGCGIWKALTEFYRHAMMADGHLNRCKACQKAISRAAYERNRGQRAEYERSREMTPERRAAKARYQTQYRERNRIKRNARARVERAIRIGKLRREPCVSCGATPAEGHHPDYSKPLDVVWLCFRCHREHEHGQHVVSHP
jgi:hypothetical protein